MNQNLAGPPIQSIATDQGQASGLSWPWIQWFLRLTNTVNAVALLRTSSAADPSTSDLPNAGQASIHKNTASGHVFLAYSDGGAIKKVQLT